MLDFRRPLAAALLACLAAGVLWGSNLAGLARASAAAPPPQVAGASLQLVQLDDARYPAMRLYFTAHDAQGRPLTDLQADDLEALEDGTPRPLSNLERLRSGVQFIFAVNEGPELANRYEGLTRFEAVQAHLQEWSARQPDNTTDDFTLAGTSGIKFHRLATPAEWSAGLSEYEPALLTARPSIAALAAALDAATEPNPNPFMRRAILYLTPLPGAAELEAYPNLTSRARQQNVAVTVWLAASDSAAQANPAGEQALRQLAADTGGEYQLFSGEQPLPDPDDWLDGLRYTYQADYRSRLAESGRHELAVALAGQEPGPGRIFELAVDPPNPIFLSPPARVERTWTSPEANAQPELGPVLVPLQIVVDFPDGHPRLLTATRLYVNDELVDENTEEPFDMFEWDVSGITTGGQYLLRAEAVDELGLSRASINTPVEVVAQVQARSRWRELLDSDRLIGLVAIVAAGAILALALTMRMRGQHKGLTRAERRKQLDPLTQPVHVAEEQPRKARPAPAPAAKAAWPAADPSRTAPAWLVPVIAHQAVAPDQRPVAVSQAEITLGSDPRQATALLDSPTVSPLHARLFRQEDNFFLADCSSVAGTWVNYAPVSNQGVRLEHGDLVHLGRMAFRFELAHPPQIPQPKVESA